MHKLFKTVLILLIALGIGLSSCKQNQNHMLRIESQDSTRSNIPFLLAFFDEDGKTYQDTLLVRRTPFEMVVPGEKCLVIIKDTSLTNPALHAVLGNRQIFFHNSTVIFRNGKDGIQLQNIH